VQLAILSSDLASLSSLPSYLFSDRRHPDLDLKPEMGQIGEKK